MAKDRISAFISQELRNSKSVKPITPPKGPISPKEAALLQQSIQDQLEQNNAAHNQQDKNIGWQG